jgi:hypothetical protein
LLCETKSVIIPDWLSLSILQMARRNNKMTGWAVAAGLVMGGAWFHETILDTLHKWGIAKNHK